MNGLATSCTTAYGCEGNLALAVDTRPELAVFRGGLQRRKTRYELPEMPMTDEHRATRKMSLLAPLCVCLVMACVLIAAWCASDALLARRRAAAFEDMEVTRVVVAPGDCLWSIAEEHGVEGATTQEVVTWIVEYNKLSSSAVSTGDLLEVPVGGAAFLGPHAV